MNKLTQGLIGLAVLVTGASCGDKGEYHSSRVSKDVPPVVYGSITEVGLHVKMNNNDSLFISYKSFTNANGSTSNLNNILDAKKEIAELIQPGDSLKYATTGPTVTRDSITGVYNLKYDQIKNLK